METDDTMQPSHTLLIGSAGMLGREIHRAWQRRDWRVTAVAGSNELDITKADAVRDWIDRLAPDLVVNAAAYTDVDGAESDEAAATRVNGEGPGHLAAACLACNAVLVHYSTDYVFDGAAASPYATDHSTAPQGAYGRSKLAGERAILAAGCEHLILRTSWLFAAHSKNFVRTMLRLVGERNALRVVDDQRGRPTSCADLAELTAALVEAIGGESLPRPVARVLHAANDGECTWYEFARAIMDGAGASCVVEPCTTAEFPRPAPRPAYSVLDLDETAAILGHRPRPWTDALRNCLDQLAMVRSM